MSLTIKTNRASLGALRKLENATGVVSSHYERLGSGLRINKASDDAAGLSIAASLNMKSRIYTQAIKNANDGISAVNVAEGAIAQLGNVVTRQIELAEQAANGSYSDVQRAALHSEAAALSDEFNRILNTTTFNGLPLLSGGVKGEIQLQLGSGEEAIYSVRVGQHLHGGRGTGTFSPPTSYAVTGGGQPYHVTTSDVDGDGALDVISSNFSADSVSILMGNGDGTLKSAVTYRVSGEAWWTTAADLDGDGYKDLVVSGERLEILKGNGDGTFKAAVSLSEGDHPYSHDVFDINGDGRLDIVTANQDSNDIYLYIGNGNGTFNAPRSYAGVNQPYANTHYDVNSDGVLDVVLSNQTHNSISILIGNGDGTLRAPVSYSTPGDLPYTRPSGFLFKPPAGHIPCFAEAEV